MRLRTGTAVVVACGALVVAGSALGSSTPAHAHNYLVSSTPAADSTLTELPEEFDITTNDDLLVTGDGSRAFALQVRDAAGRYYGDGCVSIDGETMTTASALGEPGEYTVLWQVVSADGHTVSDAFTFEWAPVGDAEISPGAETPQECGSSAVGGRPVEEPPASDPTASDPTASDPPASATPASGVSADALWLGGAGLGVLLAVIATLLVLRRRARGPQMP